MTTEPAGPVLIGFVWLLLASVTALGCMSTHASRQGDSVVVAGYPPEIQEAYKVFAQRCSRCHSLARSLNAHITDPEHWIRYITRMRRTPGSGVNRENGEVILRFLLYYAHELQAERAPAAASEVVPHAAPPAATAAPAAPALATPSTTADAAIRRNP